MKTAIYIEDGITQVVLTPETELEKSAIEKLQSQKDGLETFKGGFYACQGGWMRSYEHPEEQDSVIFVIRKKEMG